MNLLEKILQEYPEREKCKIRDPAKVETILQNIRKDGASKFQVIADFDMTLTRFHKDGKPCFSCHAIMDNSPLMPDEYREQADAVYKKFNKIEIDPNLTPEEKSPFMVEWFRSSQKLLIKYQISRNKIKEMVQTANAYLRDGAFEVLSMLNDQEVPVLIFSAGDGDVLEELLHRERAFFPNLKIISNYMVFDEDGYCVDFKDPLIHVFSKNAQALEGHSDYFEKESHRTNVLVLGDSIGDLNMDNGVQNPGAVLKIGFLNYKVDVRLDSFIEGYDVVLVDDQSFKFVEAVLRVVCAQQ